MTTRLFRFNCWLALFLLPTLACALDDSAPPPVPQPAPIANTPTQAVPARPSPVIEPSATQTEPAKPAASVQAAPAKLTPAEPVKIQPVTPKPTTIPRKTVAASAPVPTSPVKPLLQKTAPALTTQAASSPAHAPPKSPTQTKPIPVPAAPSQPLAIQPSVPASATSESAIDLEHHAIDIEVFVREDCPQCDKAKEFLTKLQNLRPQLKIIIRNVRKEPAALELLKRVAQNQGDVTLDYPAFVAGGQLIIGFSEEAGTAKLILDNLTLNNQTNQQAGKKTPNCVSVQDLSCGLIPPAPVTKPESMTVNILGHNIPLIQIGLPLFTIAMGMLDGFNHSSTWVLILMLSLLAPMKNRSAMFAIAGTFIATQGIIYFIYMSAWLHLFHWTGTSAISEIIIASIALLAGAIYFKNYMFFGQNISISSQEITKPGIYTRIRKILQADNLTTALLGTIVLALLVQLGELTFKSVFPALYTRVLTLQQLDPLSNYAYLLLYDFSYMLDDIIILIIGIITLKQERLPESEGRLLKLISGLTMFGLAAYLLLLRYYQYTA